MQKLLLQLDSDRHPSAFDRIVAHDAGVDHVLSYGGVGPGDVRALVHGAVFTRSPGDLRHTAVWIGGSDVGAGEALADAARQAFFGPFRVSVMMDSNGCNTTAAAAVARLAAVVPLKGARAVVLGATGPVGLRAAALFAREGAAVTVVSRAAERARAAAASVGARVGVSVEAAGAADETAVTRVLDGALVCLAAGAAGVTLLRRSQWAAHPTLRALADVNAVPPLGIEGIEATDKDMTRDGRRVFGALGVGGLKMKVHRACVARLFERNDQFLDLDQIYELARST
jgi:methylenetetrahydrofolate/methylenetetrahydromethanopterin dehydrogenase (NADP+)